MTRTPWSIRPHGFGGEGCLERKPRGLSGERGSDFRHHESQIAGFAINEIPEIGLELVVDVIEETVRAIKLDLLGPADEHL